MPRGTDTRAALIRATTELVAEVGYHDATTRVIAERAGVAEGSIYRHFPDKRALFVAAVVEGQRGVAEWIAGLPEQAGTRPVEEVLADTFRQLSRLREHIVPLELAMAATPDLQRHLAGPELRSTIESVGGPPHLLAEYLRAEQSLGRVRPDLDPVRLAVMLLAGLFGVQTSPLAAADATDEDLLRDLVALVVHGIAVAPEPEPGRAPATGRPAGG